MEETSSVWFCSMQVMLREVEAVLKLLVIFKEKRLQ